jgi:hypothetical protein
MRYVAMADGGSAERWFGMAVEPGDYLADFDVDAGDSVTTGVATWTSDSAEALRFNSATDAVRFWRQESTRVPLRSDGKPNRPLTAVTISIELLEGSRP